MKTVVGFASNSNQVPAEASIGKKFAARRLNSAMSHPAGDSQQTGWNASGLLVYRNANNETTPGTAGPLNGGWKGVAAGNADGWLTQLAAFVNATFIPTRPYLLSPHHECKVGPPHQCGIGCNGTAQDYVAFYRHVSTFMRNACGDRVKLCFVPLIGQFTKDDAKTGVSVVYPGDAYCDIIGSDVYQKGRSFASMGVNKVGEMALAHSKLAMIGEFGPTSGVFLQSCFDLFKAQGNWKLICTDSSSVNASTLPVWKLAAADPINFAFAGEMDPW